VSSVCGWDSERKRFAGRAKLGDYIQRYTSVDLRNHFMR
jgi:hypothetical protein